jgi:hypothetical protein
MKEVEVNDVKIQFDPIKHQYWLEERSLISGTRIGGLYDDKDWMKYWVSDMCGKLVKEYLDGSTLPEEKVLELLAKIRDCHKDTTAMDFGSDCHAWMEKYGNYKRKQRRKPAKPKNIIMKNAVQPMVDWIEEHNPEIIACEEIVYYLDSETDLDFSGTLDIRFMLDGLHCIGDYKAAKKIDKTMYVLQMVVYALAIEQCTGIPVDRLLIFKLPKEGLKFQIKTIEMTDQLREGGRIANYLKHMEEGIEKALKNSSTKKGI